MVRKLTSARTLVLGLLLALAISFTSESTWAQQFIPFNYPGATNSTVNLISNRGEMVGIYFSTYGVDDRGFTLLDGQFTAVDFPGAAQTNSSGVNDLGEIVGGYIDSGGVGHGFLLNGATYSTIDFPGSNSTTLISINNTGEIVGDYTRAGSMVTHGFSLKNGVFTTLDFPGSHLYSVPNQVNSFGVIAGWYADFVDTVLVEHGFVYNAGTFTPINFPGAASTAVNAINDGGELAGAFSSATASGGFTYLNGKFSTVNFPATTGVIFNLAVNNAGQLVPAYTDPEGHYHSAVSAIGPFAYVGSSAGINVYDTSNNLLLTTISTPSGAVSQLTAAPGGSVVYGTSFFGGVVYFIDTNSNRITATVSANTAQGAAVTPTGSRLYVTNFDGDSVTVIDTATATVIATIPLPTNGPTTVVITPDGKSAYVNHDPIPGGAPNAVTEIDTSTNTVVRSISVGTFGFGIAISPDGKTLYASSDVVGLQYIDVGTGTITKTIPLPGAWYISISADGSRAYVGEYGLGNTAVVDLRSGTIIASVPVQTFPWQSALSPDGAFLWQVNSFNSTSNSIISTASNTVVATVPGVNGTDSGAVAIPSVPSASQTITQPLSPTAPNTFNFGPHNFTVTYPAGASFSGVNMTVVAAQNSQQTFKQRVAGTTFANATCIVYSGAGGNCVDYQVSCSTTSGSQISCPSESSPTISVKTSYDTVQSIINPGFLTTPIETNEWTNIFTAFYFQRIDPTTKGRTSGFSEFVAVDLGATNGQGVGTLQFLPPLQQNDVRVFPVGTLIPMEFQLKSIAQPSESITDATAGITVVMTSDVNGNPTSSVVLEKSSAFAYTGGNYVYSLITSGYAPGTYNITVYGNAFVAQQVQFTIPAATSGAHLVTTLRSLTLNSTTNQYVATISVSNTGTAAANGLIVTASELNATATSTVLPVSLGDISSNGSATVTLTYPASAGAAGSRGVWTISESFAGGSTGAGTRVVLP